MHTATRILTDGLIASTASTAALAWRGRHDGSTAAAPINAISHWVWPRRALQTEQPSLRHTGTGAAIHYASSLLWATVFGVLRRRRANPTPANAVGDAAAVSALAALVDLKFTPARFTPGFEHRLTPRSLGFVYASFALGLAAGAWLAERR